MPFRAPEVVVAAAPSPPPEPSPPSSPIFQLEVHEGWVYFARCSLPPGRCEVRRAAVSGDGLEQTLATAAQINGFSVDAERLYLFESRNLVSVELNGGKRRRLAQAEGIPIQLGAAGQQLFWLEANPPRLGSVDLKDRSQMDFSDQLDVPALFLVAGEEVVVADGDSQTGRFVFSRFEAEEREHETRMRAELHGEVPSSLVVDGTTLYWTTMARSGASHVLRAPLKFKADTRPVELPVEGLGLGVHDLGVRGDSLYFLDAQGPARISKQGGTVERLGAAASALAAGPGGVFIGALDGGIVRLPDAPQPKAEPMKLLRDGGS